jgi:pimeloyl-ACP methyl ester carboxylesterase
MDRILSRDGTPITFQKSGSGPPLVLVHGTLSSHGTWTPVLPMLEKHFTVYGVDRRGYGESGDAPNYAIEREFEDIEKLVDSLGEEVNLLGHSFGGLCVLEATLLTSRLRSLIVYEPSPIPRPGAPLYPEGIVERIQALIEQGDRVAAVLTVFRELLGVPPDELEYYKASPRFPAWVAAAHLVPRETLAEEAYQFKPERFQQLSVPTLLLLGGDSPDLFKDTVQTWHSALPHSRIVVLPGQQHIAHYTAPDLFARELLAFLAAPG